MKGSEASRSNQVTCAVIEIVAHADLDLLFDHLINLAKKFLNSQQGFYPFGAMVKTGGDIQYVAARDDTAPDPDKPDSKVLLRLLRETFQSEVQKRTIRAAGICVNVFVTDLKTWQKSDAIQCSFEHRDGDSMNVFIKYSRDEAGDFIFGQPYSTDREREFFPDPDLAGPQETVN